MLSTTGTIVLAVIFAAAALLAAVPLAVARRDRRRDHGLEQPSVRCAGTLRCSERDHG